MKSAKYDKAFLSGKYTSLFKIVVSVDACNIPFCI